MADTQQDQVKSQSTTTPAPTTSGGSSSAPAGGSVAAPGVSREYLRGASYDQGAQSLAPDGGAALKYERSLAPPGAAAPAQDGKAPAAQAPPTAWQKLSAGAEGYKVETQGKYGYEKQPDGSYKRGSEYGEVRGGGVGWGNRKDDLEQWKDEKDHSKGKERANAAVKLTDVTGVPEPELDKIASVHKQEVSGPAGTYAGTDVSWGTWGESSSATKVESGLGKTETGKIGGALTDPGKLVSIEGPYAKGQAGGQAQAYAGIKGEAEGTYGKVAGDAKASARAYLGASGQAGITQDGASAEGKAGVGIEAKVSADADYTSPELKVAGVSTPLTAGAGVHGEASAYAKAGAGGGAYLTRDKVGLWGSAGAAAAAEAKADVHGHIGPVAGQYEVGVLAGAGIGIEGGILYEDGKLTIGGRAYAALGYGVSTGGKITIDLKQSYELGVALLRKAQQVGIQGAQAAFRAADADNDGKLSLNDAATHGSNAMKAGAEGLSTGVDGVISAMDRDGDGKWDARKDIGAGVDQAGKAIHQAGKDVYAAGAKAVDGAVKRGQELYKDAHKAADLDGDGSLGMGDVKAGATRVYDRASKAVGDAYATGEAAVKEAQKWGQERVQDAQKAAEAAYKFADRTGDGKLGLDDVQQGAGELAKSGHQAAKDAAKWTGEAVDSGVKWAGQQVDAAGKAIDSGVKWAGQQVDAAGKAIHGAAKSAHKTLDRSGDGKLGLDDARIAASQAQKAIEQRASELHADAVKTYQSTVKEVHATYKRVYDAADLNRDGKVDSADAKTAVVATQKRATELYGQAQKTVSQVHAQAVKTYEQTRKQAVQAVDTAKKALDRTGDGKLGLDDVQKGASEAYAAAAARAAAVQKSVTQSVQSTVKSAQESINRAGTTLQQGWTSASQTASGALNRFGSFTGLW